MTNEAKISLARGLSETGNTLRQTVLALCIFACRRSPQDLVIAEVLETLGFICGLFLAPAFIDRIRYEKSMLFADVACSLNSILLIFAATVRNVELLWFGSFLMTLTSIIHTTGLRARIGSVSGGSLSKRIYGFSVLELAVLGGGFIGLLSGSALVQKIPYGAILGVDAFTFIVSSFLILRISRNLPKAAQKPVRSDKNLLASWRRGFEISFLRSSVKQVLLGYGLYCIAFGLTEATLVGFQKSIVEMNDSDIFITRAITRLCGIFGSILLMRGIHRPNLSISAGILALGTSLVSIANRGMTFLGLGFFGLGGSLNRPVVSGHLQHDVASVDLGKVEAFRGLFAYLGILVGNLSAILIARYSLRYSFPVVSLLLIGSALVWWPVQTINENSRSGE